MFELTVPNLTIRIGHFSSLKSKLKPKFHNLIIHQRVPTQIDRFKLLKSFAINALASKRMRIIRD